MSEIAPRHWRGFQMLPLLQTLDKRTAKAKLGKFKQTSLKESIKIRGRWLRSFQSPGLGTLPRCLWIAGKHLFSVNPWNIGWFLMVLADCPADSSPPDFYALQVGRSSRSLRCATPCNPMGLWCRLFKLTQKHPSRIASHWSNSHIRQNWLNHYNRAMVLFFFRRVVFFNWFQLSINQTMKDYENG